MQCPRCQAENREGRRFCAECGTSLALPCASCGFSNEPGEKFCGGCGMLLTSVHRTPEPHGRLEEARAELSTAIELYLAMEMMFWLPRAEAALAAVVESR